MGHRDQPAQRTRGGRKDSMFQNPKAFQNGWRTAGVEAEKPVTGVSLRLVVV